MPNNKAEVNLETKTKKCARCKETFGFENFSKYHKGSGGVSCYCFPCERIRYKEKCEKNPDILKNKSKARRKAYRERHPDVNRIAGLRKKFNMSLETYNKMHEEQGGVCKICGKPETVVDPRLGRIKNLSIDHDHTTGQIRGLLCTKCNTILGMSNDNINILKSSINYLNKYSEMYQELLLKLEQKRLNLSHFYLLQDIRKKIKIEDSTKNTAAYATLVRKDFIADDQLTEKGKDLLLEVEKNNTKRTKKEKNKECIMNADEMFNNWWESFPATDRISVGEHVLFPETRGLRTGKKDKVKERYIEILNEGIYSHKELLDALTYEIEMRIAQSIEKGENKLTFMKGSLTYLNQTSYESFIEIAKVKRKPNSKSDTVII